MGVTQILLIISHRVSRKGIFIGSYENLIGKFRIPSFPQNFVLTFLLLLGIQSSFSSYKSKGHRKENRFYTSLFYLRRSWSSTIGNITYFPYISSSLSERCLLVLKRIDLLRKLLRNSQLFLTIFTLVNLNKMNVVPFTKHMWNFLFWLKS